VDEIHANLIVEPVVEELLRPRPGLVLVERKDALDQCHIGADALTAHMEGGFTRAWPPGQRMGGSEGASKRPVRSSYILRHVDAVLEEHGHKHGRLVHLALDELLPPLTQRVSR
jgi:hypothetical protein